VSTAPDTATDGPADVAADMAVDMAVDVAADKTPDTTVDLAPDTTPDVMADATPDTTAGVVNGCIIFTDRTAAAADRTLTWDLTIATSAERCITVKVGQVVAWAGAFATHPLTASGGDTPNPVPNYGSGVHGTVTFNAAGTFGYKCTVHATMTGAVQVVP
jgi:plastocyanin